MLRIPCPHCGPRDHVEFHYNGDATTKRPDTAGIVSDAEWDAYMYLRDDPAGEHAEYWHHTHGCRQWLLVRRNTVNQAILSVDAPRARGS